jgi:dimethylargininase
MRRPAQSLADCQLTHLARVSIDFQRVCLEHDRYGQALVDCGVHVEVLPADEGLPDCVFVEDMAIVLDEVAILCRPGAKSRRQEVQAVAPLLSRFRESIATIEAPGTLEGGDVLRIDRTLCVGCSSRTNKSGIEQLTAIVRPLGYDVIVVPVSQCLHLKTACAALPDGRLLVNQDWINDTVLHPFERIPVPPREPWGANVVCVNGEVITAAAHQETAEMIRQLGFRVHSVPLAEIAKAEGGATCLSLIFRDNARTP